MERKDEQGPSEENDRGAVDFFRELGGLPLQIGNAVKQLCRIVIAPSKGSDNNAIGERVLSWGLRVPIAALAAIVSCDLVGTKVAEETGHMDVMAGDELDEYRGTARQKLLAEVREVADSGDQGFLIRVDELDFIEASIVENSKWDSARCYEGEEGLQCRVKRGWGMLF